MPCHTTLPAPSTTHIAVSDCDTSDPTNCSCTMTASAHPAALCYRVQQAKRSRRRSRHVLWRTPFHSQSKGTRCDPHKSGRLAEIEPGIVSVRRLSIDRNTIAGAQRGYSFACPTIAMARLQPVAGEKAGDDVVLGDERQCSHSFDGIGWCAGALTPSASRQPMLGMGPTGPVNSEHDLGRAVVEISHDFMNERPHDTLLEACICCGRRPNRMKAIGQCGKVDRR